MKLWDTCVAQYQGLALVFCEPLMYQCWSVPEKMLNVLNNKPGEEDILVHVRMQTLHL